MAAIVVCGAGVIGLSTAMLLTRDGHRVTVLERDAAPPPPTSDAWGRWLRPGVGQFHQPHTLHPRFRLIVEQELPGLIDRLSDAGCIWLDYLDLMPPLVRDRSPREGDDRFRSITGRRPIVEAVVAAAAAEDGIDVRRGVSVAALLTGPSVVEGAPHVIGVRTTDGAEFRADLVVDAMGRRTKLADWLREAGGTPPHTESEECGFVYHSRYFRGAAVPSFTGPPVVDLGTISVLTIPADNRTWSVTVWAASSDTALRNLRDAERFEAVVRACPLQAPWLDGESLSDVITTAGVLETGACLALPEEVFSRPGFMDKVLAHAGARTWTPPGPDRAALLGLVGS